MADLQEMGIAELEALNEELMVQRAAIKARQQEIKAVLDSRVAEKEALAALDKLTPEGQAALAQALTTRGIDSGEAFGKL
jgi:hypothetical protein